MISKKGIINDAVKYLVYPLIVNRRVRKNNIKHITSQDLAYILKLVKLEKTIVTCHDIIPWVYDNDRLPTTKLKMKGLLEADMIHCFRILKKRYYKTSGVSKNRISIVSPAVDHDIYYMKRDKRNSKEIRYSGY